MGLRHFTLHSGGNIGIFERLGSGIHEDLALTQMAISLIEQQVQPRQW
jgi:hypothetical protein